MSEFQLPIQNMTFDLKKKLMKVPLGELPCNDDLLSEKPLRGLTEDIALHGQITPIQVTKSTDGAYVVISGRRRIKALRELAGADPEKWKTIDAIMIEDVNEDSAITLSAVENNLRSENPLTDLKAIEYLKNKYPGISFAQIAVATGIPIPRIKKRLKLDNLQDGLKKAVVDGKINLGVAEEIAKLNDSKQQLLLNKYIADGKISMNDVIVAQQARVQESFAALPAFPDLEPLVENETVGYIIMKQPDIFAFYTKIEEAEKAYNQTYPEAKIYKVINI